MKTALFALILLVLTPGCSIIQQGGGDSPKNSNTSNTTFVYTYSATNRPVEAARVLQNTKIKVQVTDLATKEKYDTEIDAGGWILVKPESPVGKLPAQPTN